MSAEGEGSEAYGAHALMVCRLSLMIARAVNLSEEALQDLGVAAMFHDMGYATREGADPKMDLKVLPPFRTSSCCWCSIDTKTRGFSPSKINRALATLEHHKDFDSPSGQPTIMLE